MQNYIYFRKKTSFLLFFTKKYEYPFLFYLDMLSHKYFYIVNIVSITKNDYLCIENQHYAFSYLNIKQITFKQQKT